MRSDADGSVSFNSLYLARLDILLTHTHTHTHTHTQGTWRNFTLIKPFYTRAKRAVNLVNKGLSRVPFVRFIITFYLIG